MKSEVWQDKMMTHCSLCNSYFELKWSIGYPYENLCSTDCRQRWEQIKRTSYPALSEKEMEFWEKLFKEKRQKEQKKTTEKLQKKLGQWTKTKKIGPKVGHKEDQKSGPTLSLRRVGPLVLDPVLPEKFEPLFPVELLEEENDG